MANGAAEDSASCQAVASGHGAPSGASAGLSGDDGPLSRLVGQHYVVRAIRKTLAELEAADGMVSRLPEVFFFYGFPGSGKTYLAKLIAEAYHGSASKPYFGSFKMQDYKDQVRRQPTLT